MPYICLARNDIPDGVLQVLDLAPNSSQAIPSLNPPGETRYVNRVKRGTASITADGLLGAPYLEGLEAYLIDKVEPGGIEQATGSITVLAGLAAAETFTLNGVVFTAVNGAPNPAVQEFQDIAGSGSIANTVTSIVSAITNAASIAAMKLGTITGSYVHAVAASPVVTLSARTGAGATLTGWAGNVTMAKSLNAHMTLSGTRLTRTHEIWTPAVQAATAAALIARVDAGSALALSDINTVLSAQAGADLSGTTEESRSNGSVADLLAVLAGRTYRAPQVDTTRSAAAGDVDANRFYKYMDATYPTFKWHDTTGRGAFTSPVKVNGDVMLNGEIKASVLGGTTVNREVAGIRHTYNVDAVVNSLLNGQLNALTTTTLLWPDSDVVPHFPWSMQPSTAYARTTASRLVTVYDDDGSILS